MKDLDKQIPRKPLNLIDLQDDKEIQKNLERRLITGDYITKRKSHGLIHGLSRPFSRFSISEANNARSLPLNFSLNALGDYVCSLVDTRIIGAAHGRIEKLLLTVPPNDDPPVHPTDERHFQTLMSSMDQHTKFILLCHADQIPTIESWVKHIGLSKERVQLCLSIFHYSIWAQDAYVCLIDGQGESILCEGVNFPRYDDMSIADDVAAQTDVRALQSYLYFQGGNILPAKDLILIGTDYIKKNLGRAHLESENKIADQFTQLFGNPVLSLGRDQAIPRNHRANPAGNIVYLSGTFQPIFHIDMYVTPTGVIGESGREICMVGRPSKARSLVNEPAGPHDYDIYFEETAEQLKQHFEVVELPLYPVIGKKKNECNEKLDWHYHLTYNNVVLENYIDESGQRKRVVYMSTYAGDADEYRLPRQVRELLDNEAEKIWKDIGFEVRKLDGLEDLARGWGSVHCITKELLRTHYD